MYHFTGQKIPYHFRRSGFFEKICQGVGSVSCCDEVVDEENFLALYLLEKCRIERIFLSDRGSLCFGATRLM